MKMEKKDKIKLVALVVVAVMAIIIFLQNTEMAEARIFFLRIEMSRALLLILTFALGLLTGILVAVNFLRRKTKP
ncbi:MAG: LapA family protein [Sedimentisphaerales bacterium]|nr:LapA family protein [Sedimentisphaerales bacterium]HNY76892.1 LapA family protein [Sedimentisphaerales bacterium]HOC62746.1 LapA family protein [Sedimentisphaerales bacterium]HOH62666.1 LapA family protein [Sedimentisphaerales bacterium]HPY49529.1 LapA family protein [Sedimentisphaerales bacterium]